MAVETANNQKSRCELPVHSVGLWEQFVFAEVLSFCTCDRVSTCYSKANTPYLWKTNVVRVLIPLGQLIRPVITDVSSGLRMDPAGASEPSGTSEQASSCV